MAEGDAVPRSAAARRCDGRGRGRILFAPAGLFARRVARGFWAVGAPASRPPVSVVTDGAREVLRFFESGRTRAEAHRRFREHPRADLRRLIRELESIGLLGPRHEVALREAPPETLTAWIHVTDRCTLRCRYCYLEHRRADMSPETAVAVVRALFRSARRHGIDRLSLRFAGGEALLNVPAIEAAIAEADTQAKRHRGRTGRDMAVGVDLLTNGSLFPDRLLPLLASHGARVMVSLDGLEADHDAQRPFPDGSGSFARVVANLRRIKAAGVPVNTSTVITGRNLVGIPALVEFFLSEEVPFVLDLFRENPCAERDAGLPLDHGELVRVLKQTFEVVRRHLPEQPMTSSLLDFVRLGAPRARTCGACVDYVAVGPEGRFAKCHMAISETFSDCRRRDPLGDVLADRAGLQNPAVDEKPGCRRCRWRYFCAGGCPLLAFRTAGSYAARSPYCDVYRALIPDVIALEGLRLLKWGG